MPRTNLARMARQNEAALKERYDMLCSRWMELGRHPELVRFYDHCERNWRVSLNLPWEKLDYFLNHGQPSSLYRYHRDMGQPVYKSLQSQTEGETPVDWDSFEKIVDKEFAQRRRKFNEFADREEEFTYGAYYLQGKGANPDNFGKYLFLLKRGFLDKANEISFLKADSLQNYVSKETDPAAVAVMEEALLADLANNRSVTWLLSEKKSPDLERLGHDACLETVTGDEYLEAQIADPIGFEAVEKVKVRALLEEEIEIYSDWIVLDQLVKVEDLDTEEKKNAYYYILITREFPQRGVKVEEF